MALLCFNSLTPLYSSPPSSSSTLAVATTAVSRLHLKPIYLPSKSWSSVRISTTLTVKKTGALIFRAAAAADADGTAPIEDGESPAESKKEVMPIDKLPLESKLQERQEQKLKMKLAKKIRLRRKRLVRKRKMRKKGRWPPSKMKKLKNV